MDYQNKLKINDSKTEFIIFRSPLLKQNLSGLSVSVGDMQVSPYSKVNDLGVDFDQYLTFHDHISGICKYTHFHLRGIGIIRNLLTFDATAQLIHALITSRLDFCSRFETLVSAISLISLAVGFLTFGISLVYDFSHDFILKSLSIIFWSAVCSFPTHISLLPSSFVFYSIQVVV